MTTAYQRADGADQHARFRPPLPSNKSRGWNRKTEHAGRESIVLPADRLAHGESGGEGKAILGSSADPRVRDVFEQPPAVAYVDDDGVTRRHTVDLLVVMRDGTRIACLVKPRAKAERMKLKRLLELLAVQVPRSFADRWVHLHEGKLTRNVVANGQLVLRVKLDGPRSDDPAVAAMAAVANRPMTVAEAVAACPSPDGFWSVVRLVADGRLRVVDGARLDYPATVEPTGECV